MTLNKKDWKDSPDASTPVNQAALEDLEQRVYDSSVADATAAVTAQKGAANGIASLGSTSKVPTTQLPPLDQIPAPTGDVSLASHKLTNVADPVNPQDGATRAFVLANAGSGGGTATGTYKGDWQANTAYKAHDMVTQGGILYAANTDFTSGTDFSPVNWTAVSGGAFGDATATTKGVIQLAGDLGGTSSAPTVPNLAAKQNTSEKGAANGYASLGANGRVPDAQLPAVVAGRPGMRPSGVIAESFPFYSMAVNNVGVNLGNGTMKVTRFDDVVPAGTVITSITFVACTTTDSSADQTHLWFALYDAADFTLKAVTTDDTTNLWLKGTARTLNLSSPYTATVDFVPLVGLVQVATTRVLPLVASPSSASMADAFLTMFDGCPPGGNSSGGLSTPSTAPATCTAPTTVQSPCYCLLK